MRGETTAVFGDAAVLGGCGSPRGRQHETTWSCNGPRSVETGGLDGGGALG